MSANADQLPLAILSPGEVALIQERLDFHRQSLDLDGSLDAVEVCLVNGEGFVCDGTHRVRTLIDHATEAELADLHVFCVIRPLDEPLHDWRLYRRYYGHGADAFLKLPSAREEDIGTVSTAIYKAIQLWDSRHMPPQP